MLSATYSAFVMSNFSDDDAQNFVGHTFSNGVEVISTIPWVDRGHASTPRMFTIRAKDECCRNSAADETDLMRWLCEDEQRGQS